MMWRFVVFLAAIVVAIGSYVAYDRFHVPGRLWPPEDRLCVASLLLVISLIWMAAMQFPQ
jgi:hypothetical protein